MGRIASGRVVFGGSGYKWKGLLRNALPRGTVAFGPSNPHWADGSLGPDVQEGVRECPSGHAQGPRPSTWRLFLFLDSFCAGLGCLGGPPTPIFAQNG